MLILTRRVEETLTIGDNIKVTVISARNGVVKLGIEAPKEVTILREELLTRGDPDAPKE